MPVRPSPSFFFYYSSSGKGIARAVPQCVGAMGKYARAKFFLKVEFTRNFILSRTFSEKGLASSGNLCYKIHVIP